MPNVVFVCAECLKPMLNSSAAQIYCDKCEAKAALAYDVSAFVPPPQPLPMPVLPEGVDPPNGRNPSRRRFK